MGFFDALNSEMGREGLAMLAAAGPQAQPMGFGQRMMLAQALQDSWGDSKMKRRMQEMQLREAESQIARQQQEWAAKDAAARAQAEQRAAIPGLFSPGQGGGVGGFDVRRALDAGIDPKTIQELAALQNVGRAEVARTVEGTDEQGRPVTTQYDKYGQPVGAAVPQWKAPMVINQGDRQTLFDPGQRQTLGSIPVNMSQAERDASARGWAGNALARERLAFDKGGGADAGKPQYRDGQWVMPPRGMQPGQAVPAVAPAGAKDANDALALIGQAKQIIPDATGSGVGSVIDGAMRFFGSSTKGDTAIGQLQAIEGALVSKMPKMSGPQSDKDVALYKQMAGVVGDPWIPRERKLAALKTIEEIQRRYAGHQPSQPAAPGQLGSGTFGGGMPQDISSLLNKYGSR